MLLWDLFLVGLAVLQQLSGSLSISSAGLV